MQDEHTSALCDHLYEAALDEGLWDDALCAYAGSFGGVGTVILEPGKAAPVIDASSGIADALEAYNSEWWQHDLVVATAQRMNLARPGIVWDDDIIPREVKDKSFYFQDFLAKFGVGSIATIVAQPAGGSILAINVQRRLGLGLPDEFERRRFADVSRHLTRALAVRMRLDRGDAIQRSLAHQLSSFDCAVAVLDGSGQVLDVNEAFSSLAASGMTIGNRRIRIAAAVHQRRFDEAWQTACGGARQPDTPDTLLIPRPSSLLPLLVRVVPFSGRTGERFAVRRPAQGALVLVIDPSHQAYPDLDRLLVRLGLTPMQARVAVLIASGHTTRGVADILCVGEETVRSHLKGIFGRLGLTRQSDIVRLVARAAPFKGE